MVNYLNHDCNLVSNYKKPSLAYTLLLDLTVCFIRNIHFKVSYINREENTCVDDIVNTTFVYDDFIWQDSLSNYIRNNFFRRKYELPSFKFQYMFFALYALHHFFHQFLNHMIFLMWILY